MGIELAARCRCNKFAEKGGSRGAFQVSRSRRVV